MTARPLLVAAVAVAVGFSGAIGSQRALDRLHAHNLSEELLYLPNDKLLNHCTAGSASIVADMLWIKCIQYTAKHFKSDYKFTWLNHMCDMVTRLDPYFTDAYRYGAIFLAALKADDDASVKLLERGMINNPDQWILPHEIAMVYLLNRRNQPGSQAQAARYLAMAAAMGDAPARVAELAASLQQRQNLGDIERKMWADIARTSKDRFMRDLAVRKLVEVDLRESCAHLSAAMQRYVADHGQPPRRLEDLVTVRLIRGIPPDPLGGRFFIDDSGSVQNTTLLDGLKNDALNKLRSRIDTFKKELGRWPTSLKELVDTHLMSAIPPHPYPNQTWQYNPATGEVS